MYDMFGDVFPVVDTSPLFLVKDFDLETNEFYATRPMVRLAPEIHHFNTQSLV